MKKVFLAILSATGILFHSTVSFSADLVETAATSGGIQTFVNALKTTGLTETFKNTGPYTIFAPENAAFDKLPSETKDALMKDKTRLAQVLQYHVIPGKIRIADIKPGNVKTLQGDVVILKSDNGKVNINEANVTQSDVLADNGIIHIIDTVILP